MPRKTYVMRRPRWAADAFRFACMETDGPFPGIVSLTVLDALARPLTVETPRGRRRVVDSGYHWVQLAPRDERWWLTAMFDEERRLVQFYFDITFGNLLLPGGESRCPDAYLDVILEPDGETRIVDAAELAAAREAGELTQEEAIRAEADAAAVAACFSGRTAELESLCRSWMEELLPRLEEG